MPFPFTFVFSVPGIINPFNTPAPVVRIARSSSLQQPSRSPTPVSRKRGWHPAFSEPSVSTTTVTSTGGYLYPPVRSGDYFMTPNESDQHDQHEGPEMPPLKKRRGLAGTIISTAVGAALIGTAVGLTVYRLWRNRGKLQQEHPIEATPEPCEEEALSPPPPYDYPSHIQHGTNIPRLVPLSPPSSTKKPRQLPRQNKHAAQHRRRKGHLHRAHPDHASSSSHPPNFQTQPEFDFEREPQTDQVEDKMLWIGDKLGMLIEQGKRALNAHVVVASDAMEDEVDDGSDAWEEERGMRRHSPSHSASVRHTKRPKTLNLGPGQSTHHLHHPSSPDFNFPVSSSAPNSSFVSRGRIDSSSYSGLPASHSTTSLNNISIEDPSTFESRELRESMERARQRLMARRLGNRTT